MGTGPFMNLKGTVPTRLDDVNTASGAQPA